MSPEDIAVELVPGRFLPETRERFGSIIRRLKEQEAIEGVILGGTELPLLLRRADGQGLPLLDTTRLHVEEAVSQLLAPGRSTCVTPRQPDRGRRPRQSR
jgi:aspartate/glutamate racemase